MNPSVIIEKYKKWNYVDSRGFYIWTNKYGDIIKIEDKNGKRQPVGISINHEAIQDLRAYGIDIEVELTALLSREIAAEIDRQIITELINGNV